MSNHAGSFVINRRHYDADNPALEKMSARVVDVHCNCGVEGWRVTAGPGEHDVLPEAKGLLAKHQHEAWDQLP